MNRGVRSFYEGKNVLLTGTTGFVGKVILEKYLRSVPQVNKLILLMRKKQGKSVSERFMQQTIKNPIFNRLKKELGKDFESYIQQKVQIIEADLLESDLGLSESDRLYIQENVNIILNCAASIDFNAKLVDALNINVIGSLKMFALAQSCKQLDNFIHVSTCYVNSDKRGFIEEDIYSLQQDPEQCLQEFLNTDPEKLEQQTPQILGKYPNTYTYTKALTERIMQQKAPKDMTITIVRPSIVGSACKEPFKGWVENLSASSAVFTFIGLGVVHNINAQEHMIGDIVPVDMVSNYCIAAGALFANKNSITVCNAGTSAKNPMHWGVAREMCIRYWQYNPPEKKASTCHCTLSPTPQRMRFLNNLKQVYPIRAYKAIADIIGTPQMKKDASRSLKVINRATNIQELFSHFSGNEWIFDNKNALYLMSLMNDEEKEIFWIDSGLIDWREYLLYYQWGLHTYILNENIPQPLVSDILLSSTKTYFSDIQWCLQQGKFFQTRSKSQYTSMVLNSSKVIQEINNLIEYRTIQKQNQVKTHKQFSYEKIKMKCKQDAINLADEMIANYNMKILRFMAWAIHKIFRQIYEKVVIDDTVLRQIQHHDEKLNGPIIFIPTHRSYIDFMIVSYVLFAFKIQAPHIAAAEDFLKMAIVPHFLRMAGAFFLRRKLAEDLQPLYKAMLFEYITRLLMDNCFIEFFIEGTRSRNFKMLSPKFGILGTIVDAVQEEKIQNAIIIPLTINYEKVLEEDTYPYELMGEEKVKESTMRLIKASKVIAENYGKIYIEFCEPIPVKQYINNNASLDKKQIINNLGYEITYRLQDKIIVMPPTLVASILLMHRKGIMEHILVNKVSWLVEKIKQRGAQVGGITTQQESSGVAQAVRSAILLLQNNLIKSKKTVFEMSVAPLMDFKNILMLNYYRNGLHHIFFQESILCVAICSFGQQSSRNGINIEDYWKETSFLLKLLQKEHVPKRQINTFEQFLDQISLMCNYGVFSYNTESKEIKIMDEQMVNFLCGLCWPVVESYWITSVYFFTLKKDTHHNVKEFQLPQYVQWFAENLFDENVLEFTESSSLDMLKNATQNFIELGVIKIENENNIKNQGIVRNNIPEKDLQDLESHINRFLKRHYSINASQSSPMDLARRTVLADYQQINPKL